MRAGWTRIVVASVFMALAAGWSAAQPPDRRTEFRIKYVAEGAVYLDGGRAAGLAEQMRLTVVRKDATVAELVVASVAESSAVCEIKTASAPLERGDVAQLSAEDGQRIQMLRGVAGGKRYAQVVTFTEGDPLDEEVRELAPHPKLPEINRIRGRIGFEYNGIHDNGGSGMRSSDLGVVFRSDMTRIGGTYWNLSGYTRFRANSRTTGPQQPTLNDLLNRTYHLTLSYSNPNSRWVAGFGRFYLPWAASLSTIDGAYVGRRYGKATAGMFLGSTPDPTAWNYNPNRQMIGSFVNFEGGSFDDVKYSSTTGVAFTRVKWRPERQYLFFENSIYFKRYFSIYHNLEADKLRTIPNSSFNGGAAVSRSFLTLRWEPSKIISFDLNHNYFRDLPTADVRLIGTGLLDKLLFQGISGGFRLSLPYRTNFYTNLGRSNKTGDQKSSLNQMYGFSAANILGSGIRGDIHYSRFSSSFGTGNYKAVSINRQIGETLRFELQGGQQNFGSALSAQTRSRYVNGNLDWFFSAHYFMGGGMTVYRGQIQNYMQTYTNVGYRF